MPPRHSTPASLMRKSAAVFRPLGFALHQSDLTGHASNTIVLLMSGGNSSNEMIFGAYIHDPDPTRQRYRHHGYPKKAFKIAIQDHLRLESGGTGMIVDPTRCRHMVGLDKCSRRPPDPKTVGCVQQRTWLFTTGNAAQKKNTYTCDAGAGNHCKDHCRLSKGTFVWYVIVATAGYFSEPTAALQSHGAEQSAGAIVEEGLLEGDARPRRHQKSGHIVQAEAAGPEAKPKTSKSGHAAGASCNPPHPVRAPCHQNLSHARRARYY